MRHLQTFLAHVLTSLRIIDSKSILIAAVSLFLGLLLNLLEYLYLEKLQQDFDLKVH
jgi:hypothetical protein